MTRAEASAGTVTELSASYDPNAKEVQIGGTAENLAKGIVVVEILTPSGGLMYFGTAAADPAGDFESVVAVTGLTAGTYTVRCADYIGGSYRTATFVVAATPVEPPSPLPGDGGGPTGDPGGGGDASAGAAGSPPSSSPVPTAQVSATVVVSGGNMTVSVTHSAVAGALSKALEEAAQSGSAALRLEIKGEASPGATSCQTTVPKDSVALLTENPGAGLTLSSPVASVTFDPGALLGISQAADGDLSVLAAVADKESISDAAREVVGERPVYRFEVRGGNVAISQFAGTVDVSVPYTLSPGEDPDAIVIYFINSEGEPELVRNCVYDPITGSVTFKTDHFSLYAVGYNKVTFYDVPEDAWYSRAVSFLAARGITDGVGGGRFAPLGQLTRGEALVLIMRAYGIQPATGALDNFADAGDAYYTGYLAEAKRLGISDGVGADQAGHSLFAPSRQISSQEVFVMLHRALSALHRVPAPTGGQGLASFKDAADFATWAREASDALAKAGIIQGSEGRLCPKELATRARMAQMLFRLLKS